uniref:Glycosyltransferase 2-like domain-containing protein n=1 Tax=uncultured Bacillota bacterium TaxID=344338 RepID=A0A650EPT2_9FIRM|nr:hypothetical protein Firmicute1046_3440 [uncultured Firmicutes bacterium]
MKELSVIVPVYNAEEYIDRCIESIISQECNAEIIVIDDGSTDSTPHLLEKYKDKIKLITLEKNSGNVAAVRNVGLDNACGELITFCDADDWYMPGAFKKILELQKMEDADIVRFSYICVYPDGKTELPQNRIIKDEMVVKCDFADKVYPQFINGIGLNSVWASVFKRKIIENLRFLENFKIAEDAAFSMEAYTDAASVRFCSDPLYCYYRRYNSLTGSGSRIYEKYKYNFCLAKRMLSFLPQWGMNIALWRVKTILRPLRLTVDKMKRSRRQTKGRE